MINSVESTVLIFGAGAIGTTLAHWLTPSIPNLYLFDKPEIIAQLKSGITCYEQAKEESVRQVTCISSLSEIPPPDVILLCVKNYSLDGVAQVIQKAYGDYPVIIGLQNGRENQRVLPRYFSKVSYGVVCYNAWQDKVGKVGYQKKGPLVLGMLDGTLDDDTENHLSQSALQSIVALLNSGVPTQLTPALQNAVVCKMLANLTNSVTTLVGFGFRELDHPELFQRIMVSVLYEGMQILKQAGYQECKLDGMPSWFTLAFAAKMPAWITRPLFMRNMKKMVISSMAQDIVLYGRHAHELESINGEILHIAAEHGIPAPINGILYQLCQEQFAADSFHPMSVKALYQALCN